MRGKKTFICSLAGALGIQDAMVELKKYSMKGYLPVLAYHRVLDIEPEHFPFEEANVSCSSHQFRKQLDYIGKKFVSINFNDLKNHLDEGSKLPENPIIITFDDGYRDNYEVAYPLLKEYGLTATFFLTVQHICTREVFEFEKLSYAIKNSSKKYLDLSSNNLYRMSLAGQEDKAKARAKIIHALRNRDEWTAKDMSQRILEQLEIEIPADLGEQLLLSWDQVKEMALQGMTFGSHTLTHPILSRLSEERLKEEITQSKAELESFINNKVVVFSYPAGGKAEYFGTREREAVRDAGYRFAVSYFNGMENLRRMDPYCIKRLRISNYLSLEQFKMGLILPWMVI